MVITRNDVDEEFRDGEVVSSTPAERDITDPAVRYDLHDKLRRHLDRPAKDLAGLRRQVAALTRLVLALDGARDLLVENDDT